MPTDEAPIFDAHAHLGSLDGFDQLQRRMKRHGIQKAALMSLAGQGDCAQNPLLLAIQAAHPEDVIIFGGLDHLGYRRGLAPPYAEQIKLLLQSGFSGLKMIEGKPQNRMALGRRLDDPVFDDMYDLLEKRRVPVLFHVADPATFWDAAQVPDFAKEQGWFYDEKNNLPYAAFYAEIEGLLKKFPCLHLILAHFYFLSDDAQAADDFLKRHPTVCFDLTPGSEMFFHFAQNPELWRTFFMTYQDRLIFGTDNRDLADESEQKILDEIIDTLRFLLEQEGSKELWGQKVEGLALPETALDQIERKNICRLVESQTEREGTTEAALDVFRRSLFIAQELGQVKKALEIQKLLQNFLTLKEGDFYGFI